MEEYKSLLRARRPQIVELLEPKDILGYFPEWPTARIEDIRSKPTRTEQADCFLSYLIDSENDFSLFKEALKNAKYDPLRLLLEGKDIKRYDSFLRLLKIFQPDIEKEIAIDHSFLSILESKDLIEDHDREKIASEVDRGNSRNGLYILIKCLPRRLENWPARFMEALKESGNDNVLCTLFGIDKDDEEPLSQERIRQKNAALERDIEPDCYRPRGDGSEDSNSENEESRQSSCNSQTHVKVPYESNNLSQGVSQEVEDSSLVLSSDRSLGTNPATSSPNSFRLVYSSLGEDHGTDAPTPGRSNEGTSQSFQERSHDKAKSEDHIQKNLTQEGKGKLPMKDKGIHKKTSNISFQSDTCLSGEQNRNDDHNEFDSGPQAMLYQNNSIASDAEPFQTRGPQPRRDGSGSNITTPTTSHIQQPVSDSGSNATESCGFPYYQQTSSLGRYPTTSFHPALMRYPPTTDHTQASYHQHLPVSQPHTTPIEQTQNYATHETFPYMHSYGFKPSDYQFTDMQNKEQTEPPCPPTRSSSYQVETIADMMQKVSISDSAKQSWKPTMRRKTSAGHVDRPASSISSDGSGENRSETGGRSKTKQKHKVSTSAGAALAASWGPKVTPSRATTAASVPHSGATEGRSSPANVPVQSKVKYVPKSRSPTESDSAAGDRPMPNSGAALAQQPAGRSSPASISQMKSVPKSRSPKESDGATGDKTKNAKKQRSPKAPELEEGVWTVDKRPRQGGRVPSCRGCKKPIGENELNIRVKGKEKVNKRDGYSPVTVFRFCPNITCLNNIPEKIDLKLPNMLDMPRDLELTTTEKQLIASLRCMLRK